MTRTVLIVDDSKLARMVVSGILGRYQPDWRPLEAGSAEKALQLIGETPVDIALIDFNMPEMDGLDLAARIRELRPEMPMAIVSANAQQSIIARARELNVAFVEKPLTDEALKPFLSGAALRLRQSAAS